MILYKDKTIKFLTYISLLLLIFTELLSSINDTNIKYSSSLKAILLALVLLYTFFNISIFFNERTLLKAYWPIIIYTSLIIPFSQFINISFFNQLKWIFAVSIGYYFYILYMKNILTQKYLEKFTLTLIFGTVIALISYTLLNQSHLIQSNYGYSLLVLIPLVFYTYRSSPEKQIIFFGIIGIFIIIALKRGPILIYTFIFMFIFIPHLIRQKNFKSVFLFFTVLIIGLSVFLSNETFINNFSERLEDTTGSGRSSTYVTFIEGILEKNLFEMLVGSGSLSSQVFSAEAFGTRAFNAKLGLMTHSDGLLIIFEYGLIGILLYLFILFKLYSKVNNHNEFKMAIYSILIMYLFTSIFSHLFFTNSSWVIFITLGLISAEIENKERLNDS